MCGIAGLIDPEGRLDTQTTIGAMVSCIAHRGPDGEGVFTWNRVAFGHRRLAILDLSEDGHQPMEFAEAGLVITFNGEIYNYLELREELQGLGYRFASSTDTEVILKAYAHWGDSCVQRFNGMWAFAILDQRNNRVFCSRDRFGVKPFYYISLPGARGIAFGSEMRQLLPLLSHIKANQHVLGDFLLTSICDHGDSTFFEDVLKLPAGSNLSFDLKTQKFSISRYYEIARHPELTKLSTDQAAELYLERLADAVKLRLRADVPVGTCLSGGLDSSSVATLAAPIFSKASGRPFSAITAVSEQESNNEAGYAKEVVQAAGMSWLQVKPTYEDFLESLPAVVKAQEEPFGSTSLTMQYYVMKAARDNGIPVLLDGQGGDETLLGYPKYYGSYLATTFRSDGFSGFLTALRAAGNNNAKMSLANAMKFLVGGLVAPARYLVYLSRHRYLSPRPAYPKHLSAFASASWDDFELQRLEISSTNLPVLLRYEDKNSMAHSIETRLPFLDYRVVETALSLPGTCKIKDGWSKWVLRKGMDGRMPDSIVWRKNKFGFEAPENLWMAKHLEEMRAAVLASPMLGHMSKKDDLASGFGRLSLRTQWRLYSIALWEKAFGVAA